MTCTAEAKGQNCLPIVELPLEGERVGVLVWAGQSEDVDVRNKCPVQRLGQIQAWRGRKIVPHWRPSQKRREMNLLGPLPGL